MEGRVGFRKKEEGTVSQAAGGTENIGVKVTGLRPAELTV